MRHTLLLAAALRATLLFGSNIGFAGAAIAAQTPHGDHGLSMVMQRGATGATTYAPTSAFPGAPMERGALSPGAGIPTSGGDASDRTLTPDGAILPGTTRPGGHSSN